MNVQELIRQTPFDEVWEAFVARGFVPTPEEAGMPDDPLAEKALHEASRDSLSTVCAKMAALDGVVPAEGEYLVVVEGYRPTYLDDDFYPDMDAFSVRRGGHEQWALDMRPWREALGLQVYEPCLERYGAGRYLAEAAYELTFWGADAEDVDEARAELFERYEDSVSRSIEAQVSKEELDSGTSCRSLEDMYAEFGIEPPSEAALEELRALEKLERPLNEAYKRELEEFLAGTGWGGYSWPPEES